LLPSASDALILLRNMTLCLRRCEAPHDES
jgi:hypothetical protein